MCKFLISVRPREEIDVLVVVKRICVGLNVMVFINIVNSKRNKFNGNG